MNDDIKQDDSGNDSPEDELRRMLERILGDGENIDPSELAKAAGLSGDPAALAAMFSQLQQAMSRDDQGIDWATATKRSEEQAGKEQRQVTDTERERYEQTINVASLWLDEVVEYSPLLENPDLLTRRTWASATMPVWVELSTPVAVSISKALTSAISEHAPEEFRHLLAGAESMILNLGGTLFSLQLGQIVGQLAEEVVSGGDIGIPLLSDGKAALIPQNIEDFGAGLEIPRSEIELYLTVRELAHARLFKHARWLRLHLITAISSYARNIRVDMERLEELAERFDLSSFDPASFNSDGANTLHNAVTNGSLINQKSPEQAEALERLETMLALIEGWVDVVTRAATTRLPKSEAIAETIRRRRASGGPAESAFSTLVGLELRPRRLRDAAVLWQRIGEDVGHAKRDALWAHPDMLPETSDLDTPDIFIARLRGDAPATAEEQDFAAALEQLIRDDAAAAAESSDVKDEPSDGTEPQ